MRIIYFDMCSIFIFVLILITYFRRRMARYQAYSMFFMLTFISLLCALFNIFMEFVVSNPPLTRAQVVLGTILSFLYKWLRNSSIVIYLLFILAITRTEHRFRPLKARLTIWAPNAVLLVLLLQNFFTGNVFSVTAENGYVRGPLLMVFYAVAGLYSVAGVSYCIYCGRFLDKGKLVALLMVFVLNAIAVYIQFVLPYYMVEMFFSSIALMILMLLVVRPEENIDSSVGVRSWQSFQTDLHTMLFSRRNVRIGVFQLPNAHEIRNYLGDQQYFEYIGGILDAMQLYIKAQRSDSMLYFEHPNNIYLMLDGDEHDLENNMKGCLEAAVGSVRDSGSRNVGFNPLICLIRCPEDLSQDAEIIKLCHRFPMLGSHNQTWFNASDIVNSRDFEIENHIEDILVRAIREKTLQMHYQPIYDMHEQRFRSAEALARIVDREYGVISPAIFIPAAERSGLILQLGTAVIDSVFKFISGHNLEELGLNYIEINLSVEQCRQENLAETIFGLQQKYGISPEQVNFEITETVFDSFEDVVERNMYLLVERGFSFSLDDYGTGYSNLQRLRKVPLKLIKIDKSLVDDIESDEGRIVMYNTISMMHGLRKKLVVEGVETQTALDALQKMHCDHIQGFYFSKPLPEDAFLDFIKAKKNPCE